MNEEIRKKLEAPPQVHIDASFTDMARSLGRIEGMQQAQTDVLAHLVERVDALTDSKLDKSTFWKVFGPVQAVFAAAISYILRGV